MDASEKSIVRARLTASGIIRYWQYNKSKEELDRWLEIMAEELATLRDQDAALKIREDLQWYGLRVPEVSTTVHFDNTIATEHLEETTDVCIAEVCSRMTKGNTQGFPVHSSVALDSREQRNTGISQTERVSKTLKNMYSQGADYSLVHPGYASTDEVEQNTVYGSPESVITRLTKADAQREGQPQVKDATGSWTWRGWNYNRVPPAIEEAVYERFKQGWSKCKLAREFGLNRRTIIRICRRCGV
jgi:hypothetical protein